jgi:5'-nucleotidase
MDSLNITARTDMREQDYYWLNIERHDRGDAPGSETHVVINGGVSVTPLRFERSDQAAAQSLREQLASLS